MASDSFEAFTQVKLLCRNLIADQKDIDSIKQLNCLIKNSTQTFVNLIQPSVLGSLYPIIKNIMEDKSKTKFKEEKIYIIETIKNLIEKSRIDKLGLFFNIYALLLFELYDHVNHKVLDISEEYKLVIIECMTLLCKSITFEVVNQLYVKENAPKLCQMLYAAVEIAKTEQYRSLRIASMECIMSIAHVLEDDHFKDVEIRNQVANVFLFFLPGVASGLKQVALEDEKIGHKIPTVALKAWGRIITILMQDYNPSDKKLDFDIFTANNKNESEISPKQTEEATRKIKTSKDIKSYINNTSRNERWYKDSDKKLQLLVAEFFKLTYHSHVLVRLELLDMCNLVTTNCLTTIPHCVSHLIKIVITLSGDENEEISKKSSEILNNISETLSSNEFETLLSYLKEGFYAGISSLPRKFNGFNEKEQLANLNLLIGYVKLFGKHKLQEILINEIYLDKLMKTLLHVSEVETKNVSLLEESAVKDFKVDTPDFKTPWKQFRYFKEDSVKLRLEKLCALCSEYDSFDVVVDFLMETISNSPDERNASIIVLNAAITGISYKPELNQTIREVINFYTGDKLWNVALHANVEGFEACDSDSSYGKIQSNIIQVCLLVEGIGKIAVALQRNFKNFLLGTLYLVLERAGSGHPLIKAAGLSALRNVSYACGYASVTVLLNENIDYFTYRVERMLNKIETNTGVLDVLSVALKYSSLEVLPNISEVIREVLLQSCDKFKEKRATDFLKIFKIFVGSLSGWLNVEPDVLPVKSKEELLETDRSECFKVTGVNEEESVSFSDEIMGKSAEEMWKEDLERKSGGIGEDIDEPSVEEYKKPDPPLEIQLTVAVLSRSLHFLPSKDRDRKLLVLEILSKGFEIIRDWEDELLPLVHQTWSPLVQRFKESDFDPLIVNCSFRLLIVLARLSKDFIKMRTLKEVLPSVLEILAKLSKDSYLKDKGASYRYSQTFRLQLELLENLGVLLADLNVEENAICETMECIFIYLSAKQPVPLQIAASHLIANLAKYDGKTTKTKLESWQINNIDNEYSKNLTQLTANL